MTMPSAAVGIDLGTSNSCVAVWDSENHRTRVIEHDNDGRRTVPSVVQYELDGNIRPSVRAVGLDVLEEAKNRGASKTNDSEIEASENVVSVRNVKRLIGAELPKSGTELEYLRNVVSCNVIKADMTDDPDTIRSGVDLKLFPIRAPSHRTSPEEVSAEILKKLKESAEKCLRHKVTHAVVAVPAHCSSHHDNGADQIRQRRLELQRERKIRERSE
eukprot:g3303.t1